MNFYQKKIQGNIYLNSQIKFICKIYYKFKVSTFFWEQKHLLYSSADFKQLENWQRIKGKNFLSILAHW